MAILTMGEYAEKKKKKKSAKNIITLGENAQKKGYDVTKGDIAPVKSTTTTKGNGYFKKSEGDFAETILGSGVDLMESFTTGVARMPELARNTALAVAPAFEMAQKQSNGGFITVDDWNKRWEQEKANDEIIKKDWYDEKKVAQKILSGMASAQYTTNIAQTGGMLTEEDLKKAQEIQKEALKYIQNDAEKNSVFDEKVDSLVESGGQLVGTAGLQFLGVPWWLTTGVTMFGSEVQDALNSGATHNEAVGSGVVRAAAEILSEKLTGGINFGSKTLTGELIDDKIARLFSHSISNKLLRNLAKVGVDASGEGFEEIFSELAGRLGKKLTYEDEKTWAEIFASEEAIDSYIDSFIGGFALGGIASGSKAIKSAADGTDFVTENTANEQKVVDAEVKNRIEAKQEELGKELTKREQLEIRKQVQKDMERGYLSTDTIESVIGGNTYKQYQDSIKNEESLVKEYETLGKTKNPTLAQTSRYNKLEGLIEEAKKNSSSLKEQLSNEVSELAKVDRLSETYLERERAKQNLELDSSSYKSEGAKKTVKNLVESGLMHNTNKAHDYADFMLRIAEDKDIEFEVTTTDKLIKTIENGNPYKIDKDPSRIEAFVTGDNKKIVVNLDASKSLNSLVGHEVTHTLEKLNSYDGLQKVALKFAETKGELADRQESINKRYASLDENGRARELTADILGDYLFTDSEFINNLCVEEPNVFKRIWNEIKYLCKMATAGSRELRELERVKHEFEKTWQDNTETKEISDTETKFSIRTEAPPKQTGVAYKVFFVKDGKLYPPMVANPEGADTPIGVWLNADVGTSAKPSKTGRPQVKAGGKGTQGGSGSLAFRPGWHLGDLPRASQFDRVNPETGKKELFPENFVWAEVEYAKDVDYQEEAMSYGYTDNGKFRHAYAGLPKLPENGYYRYRTNPKPDTVPWVITGAMKVNRLLSDAEVNAILEENGVAPVHRQGGDVDLEKFGFNNDGTVKYSLTDSDGRSLTKEQQDYFKDSKVVDEKGNLKVVYHGTRNADFTVFNRNHTYFTDSKEMADSYAPTGEKFSGYLNMTKPFVVDAKGDKWSGIAIDDEMVQMIRDSGGSVFKERGAWRTSPADIVSAIEDGIDEGIFDYDGVIIKNVDDTGSYYKGKDNVIANDYIVFNSNQFKNIDNTAPTSDADIRFSLSEPVEETKDLMAIHNLHSSELMKQIEMGGIPYPSIAVTKPSQLSHEDFGEISLILHKDSIDPQKSRYNHIYGADAYTPTFPSVDYEANREIADAISEKIDSLYVKIPENYQRSLRTLIDYDNLEDKLNSERGEQGLIERYADDYGMKQLYLAEKGEVVPVQINRTETEMTDYQKETSQHIIDRLGTDVIEQYKVKDKYTSSMEHSKQWLEKYGEELKNAYSELISNDLNISLKEAREIMDSERTLFWIKTMRDTISYLENGGVTVKEEADYGKTELLIDEKIDKTDYRQWVENLFKGIEGNSGIRNNRDLFTPSGKRRSFAQLHDPVTIENVINAMRNKEQTGQGAFGTTNIQGASAQEFKSISEVRANKDRLGIMSEEEHKEITQKINDTMFEIADRYSNGKDIIDAKATLVEAVSKHETKSGIAKYLKQYDYVYRYDESIVDDIIELRDYIRSLPTPYFEAKPRRAVGLDEVAVYVIPYNADPELKQALLNGGYSIAEYDSNVEGDRKRVVNQFEQYKFRLSDTGKTKEYGDFNIYGKDIKLKTDDVAPTDHIDDVGKMANARDQVREVTKMVDDYAPLTEEESFVRDDKQIEEHYFLDNIAPEGEEPYRSSWEQLAKPSDPMYDRDIDTVGKQRSLNAYMYENPEVKPFFQEEAKNMLWEWENSQRGEKFYNDDLYYESGGEYGWFGTKRQTSEEIEYLLDNTPDSWDKIKKGLLAIIEDNGKENNATSKRIEFMLDERLRNGYRDFFTGEHMPANEDYVNLLISKEINDYSDEAWENYLRRTNNIPSEIAPTPTISQESINERSEELHAKLKKKKGVYAEQGKIEDWSYFVFKSASTNKTVVTWWNGEERFNASHEPTTSIEEALYSVTDFIAKRELGNSTDTSHYIVEDYAPTLTTPQEYIAIESEKPKKAKAEPRMVRVKDSGNTGDDISPVAQILTEEPTPENKKSRFWNQAMELVADKGFVFENLSKKTKNRELEAKWNFIRYADSKAQDFIGEGADGVKSLDALRKEVEKKGLTKDLYSYVYHLHNIDRMSLSNRYDDVENKAVFGDSITAADSQIEVAVLEAKHPELKKYANEIYSINNYLRNLLVEGGVISQETADLWAEMYPHYVPIRRAGEHGLNINVPLDTGRTGVNAPVKRATGGSSDILPLFDTMAQRTLQTYKAVARNRFGVELKNTLGTTIGTETADVDSVIDGLDQHEELLQKGKNGRKPTFTVFEGGEKVTFEITEDMYDALKPTNETLRYTNKTLNKLSNLHRGVLTEYNPSFMARNIIKDVQDVLINSQHAAKTYANFPKAIKEMTTNGEWYKEYLKNGGERNSYFDSRENTFVEDKSTFVKTVGMPLNAISKANNFIERLPRLAEYIASREDGRSIEVSMLDSARVTTNFAAGGDLTKFLNRNGATFLNASVQGAMQQVRNIREAKMNGLKGWTQLATKYAIAGLPVILLNGLLWDDDEDYEELSDYVKQNYYVVAKYGDGKFVRIPKGRTLAVIQNALEQTMNGLTGNDEVDLESFLQLAITNLAPNNPLENNILAPIIQVANNETWYGDDLVPTRLQDLPQEEQFDESTDSISRWLGEKLHYSPYKINYLLNQYSGGIGDSLLPMFTPEAESGDDTLSGQLLAPIRDAFTTDSTLKNQNVSDFYDMSDELTVNANKSSATDEDILSNKYFNSVKGEIGKLYGEKREIQNSDLSDSEKYNLVREIQKEINALSEKALGEYDNVIINGNHATVGNRQYRLTDEGWEKLSTEQIEKQDKVTSNLGISPNEYWSNKEEYDYAFESPDKYAIANTIGGYDVYRAYSKELNDIRADKDASGKTINGSSKKKKTEYINSLDLDYGQRIILYRSLFDSKADKNTYNADIVEYLNNREDLSYEEVVTILESLDMKVHSDGSVTW